MQVFLERLEAPELRSRYLGLDELWNERAQRLNQALESEQLPVRVANLSTAWTVCYTQPSRYNWMLQYYLRAEGLALSWVGTGRFLFSLDYSEADYEAVSQRFLAAARAMERDGWWWRDAALSNKSIRRGILREMIAQRF
jgi:glutamate-1-semialdehyde 2,1-aminomutase